MFTCLGIFERRVSLQKIYLFYRQMITSSFLQPSNPSLRALPNPYHRMRGYIPRSTTPSNPPPLKSTRMLVGSV